MVVSERADQERRLGADTSLVMQYATAANTYQEVSEKAVEVVRPIWEPRHGNEGLEDILDRYRRMRTKTGQRIMGYEYPD